MNDYLTHLISKYKRLGVIIDTNILLLYIIGSINPSLIKKFARTADFDENDFKITSNFINFFDKKITTPHILTETSDLLGESNDFHIELKEFINTSEEKFIESKEIAKSESFLKFGLADSSIIEISRDAHLIFTTERSFYGYASNKGIDVIKFSDLKSALQF